MQRSRSFCLLDVGVSLQSGGDHHPSRQGRTTSTARIEGHGYLSRSAASPSYLGSRATSSSVGARLSVIELGAYLRAGGRESLLRVPHNLHRRRRERFTPLRLRFARTLWAMFDRRREELCHWLLLRAHEMKDLQKEPANYVVCSPQEGTMLGEVGS